MTLPLLRFDPLLKRTAWGGDRLGTVLGKAIGAHRDYGESWEISDLEGDETSVCDGPFGGWPISRLMARHRDALLGGGRPHERFPLLVKFIDASRRLSVQVHPNDEQARRMHLGRVGKTEAWVIIDALPGSRIFAGLVPGTDRRALEHHLDSGTIEECLHHYPARAGDCIYVPAGTVHAIGEGVLLAEIQQSSNVTLRLDDWGRVGPDGTPRVLHRLAALECVDFARGPVDPVAPRLQVGDGGATEQLARCEYFALSRLTLSGPRILPTNGNACVLIVLAGEIEIQSPDESRLIKRGETSLLPAVRDSVLIRPVGGGEDARGPKPSSGTRPASVLLAELP